MEEYPRSMTEPGDVQEEEREEGLEERGPEAEGPDAEGAEEPEEEDEATRRDREGGEQFGKALIALGLVGGVSSALFFDRFDEYTAAGALLVVGVGVVVYRFPVQIVRMFTGMSDKL